MATTPAETSIDLIHQAKVDLAAALRAAALHGFNEGVDNHFSLAVPGRDVDRWARSFLDALASTRSDAPKSG